MPWTQEKYQQAKSLLDDPSLSDPKRQALTAKISEFESDQARGYQRATTESQLPSFKPVVTQTEGSLFSSEDESKRFETQALKALKGEIPLDKVESSALLAEPSRDVLERNARLESAIRDENLPNASKLKIFNDPVSYAGKTVPPLDPIRGPIGLGNPELTGVAHQQSQWFEPTVEEFRMALKTGLLNQELLKEYPRYKPDQLSDKDLEETRAFKVFQDVAWRHDLGEAMKAGKPLHRVSQNKRGGLQGPGQAKAVDTASAGVRGLLSGASSGLFNVLQPGDDPAKQDLRHPWARTGGEVAGGIMGAPRHIAEFVGGKVAKKLPGLAVSAAGGAAAGGGDTVLRQLAQGTKEALEAADSAKEALGIIWNAFDPVQVGQNTLLGGGLGVGGHALGSTARSGARKIVTNNELGPVMARNVASGSKMGQFGGPAADPVDDLALMAGRAGTEADDALARSAAGKILPQHLKNQEVATRAAVDETAAARERLQTNVPKFEGTRYRGSEKQPVRVPAKATAARIRELSRDVGKGLSKSDETKALDLENIAAKLDKLDAERQGVTAEELDIQIQRMDAKAKTDNPTGKPDADYKAVVRILRDMRDELEFPEGTTPTEAPTAVDNFAIRDAEGNVKAVTDYSGMKVRQSRQAKRREFDNQMMGLPKDLGAEPTELGPAPDKISLQALAESKAPKVDLNFEQERKFIDTIKGAPANPNRGVMGKLKDVGESAGAGEELTLLQKLRDRADWRKLLGSATRGVSIGPGRIGNKFIDKNQLVRFVPTLKGLSGGLPKLEATPELEKLIDRYLAQSSPKLREQLLTQMKTTSPKQAIGDEILDTMVPEGPLAPRLMGGMPARPVGAFTRNKEDAPTTELTAEEQRLARAVISNLLKMYESEGSR